MSPYQNIRHDTLQGTVEKKRSTNTCC